MKFPSIDRRRFGSRALRCPYRRVFLTWISACAATASLGMALVAAPPKGEFDTWYIFGSAQLADGKAVVYTTILPISVPNPDESAKTSRAERACAQLKVKLKEFVEREMNRTVVAVTAHYDRDRGPSRDRRDRETDRLQAAGTRIIYLNGFTFSADESPETRK